MQTKEYYLNLAHELGSSAKTLHGALRFFKLHMAHGGHMTSRKRYTREWAVMHGPLYKRVVPTTSAKARDYVFNKRSERILNSLNLKPLSYYLEWRDSRSVRTSKKIIL